MNISKCGGEKELLKSVSYLAKLSHKWKWHRFYGSRCRRTCCIFATSWSKNSPTRIVHACYGSLKQRLSRSGLICKYYQRRLTLPPPSEREQTTEVLPPEALDISFIMFITIVVNKYILCRITSLVILVRARCWVMPWLQLRFDYDTTTIRSDYDVSRAPASIRRDSTRAKSERQFLVVVVS